MSKSKNSKQLHNQQEIAAKEYFKTFMPFIVEEFVRKFGGSYAMPEQHINTWRKDFDYTAEREEFLKQKTLFFIRILPTEENIYDSPRFFKIFIMDVCKYLAGYTSRQETPSAGHPVDREPYINALFKILYTDNRTVQERIQKYNDRHNQVWGQMQEDRKKWGKTKKDKQRRRDFKEFNRTGEVPANGLPFHTSEELRELQIKLYGSREYED